MKRRTHRAVLRAGAFVCLGGLVAACSGGSGSKVNPAKGTISVTADFVDVNALEHRATVEMNGVNVGVVSHIQVDGPLAKLTMRIKRSARVPADAVADVRRASLLGPDVVELTPPPNSTGALLADHAVLADAAHPAKFLPDFETLVHAGNGLLGALGAEGTSALSRVIAEGAKGFGPEGGDLRVVLDSLNTVVSGYATRTATITTLLQSLDTFSSTLAPSAQANAQALSNLARTTEVLDRQKDRLVSLLSSLSNVSVQGTQLLDADLRQITDQLNSLRVVTAAVANQQQSLGDVLHFLEGHNLATFRGVSHPNDFIQVLNDFVVCGLPGHAGGDVPGDKLNSCFDSGTGKP
ncbi:MAG: hypothetical protein NVS3B21_14240 [Acidimicrobiales bacterium]